MPKIYLAGPDVFRADALEIAEKKKAICREYGLEGMFPLDNCLSLEGMGPREAAHAIAEANEALMRSADGCIANMTPFRGPSMDVGTAYEMGFMRAQGKPVHGYTQAAGSFAERTKQWCAARGAPARARAGGGRPAVEDAEGNELEDFGEMTDNLMLDNAVHQSLGGARVEVGTAAHHDMGCPAALEPFRRCCAAIAAELSRLQPQEEEAMSPTAGSRAGVMTVESDDDFAACLHLAGDRVVVLHEFDDTPVFPIRAEAKRAPDTVFALRRRRGVDKGGVLSFWVRGTELSEKRITGTGDPAALRERLHETLTLLDE
eukprot:TRINITY_DN70772_c0_g1_i1.p1 TRINITY_DN70772_c0_g1~~TRINITY_DN70772_c0_g1_i1.p1  ORF type:complete len:345 (+),score=107.99 TRINITY_DN70772_c0_g1_i1:86-1036(+)